MQFKPRKVKDINNPIQAYIDDSNYAVQEKIDGERLLIVKTYSSIDGFNRRGESVDVPTHIANYFTQHHLPGIYDGEYVVRAKRYFIFSYLDNGGELHVPTFSRRMAETSPVLWVTTPVKADPYGELTREDKERFIRWTIDNHREGVVFVHTQTGELWRFKPKRTMDVFLTAEDDTELTFSVLDGEELIQVCQLPKVDLPPSLAFNDVIEVQYSHLTRNNKLFKPKFIRTRQDKEATECHI